MLICRLQPFVLPWKECGQTQLQCSLLILKLECSWPRGGSGRWRTISPRRSDLMLLSFNLFILASKHQCHINKWQAWHVIFQNLHNNLLSTNSKSINYFKFQIFPLAINFCTVWNKLTCFQPIRMQKLLYAYYFNTCIPQQRPSSKHWLLPDSTWVNLSNSRRAYY